MTPGIYSLVGFEVTPATAIGLLTILGFSLYDTVVVFDKVKENTRGLLGLTRRTYAEAANLALNQTLMRSINTSLIAVLPVLGLMVVGVGLLGVGTLADLALVQIVGILAGAASSVLLATPILVDLKQRDPRIREQARRVAARRARVATAASGETGESTGDEPDLSDDEALAGELRRERAMAAAAGVPARTAGARRAQPAARPARRRGRRGSGADDRRCGRRPTTTRWPGCPPWSAPFPTSRSRASCSATSPRCWPTARPSRPSPLALAALCGAADVVVGVEARGFLLGAAAALTAGTGIVPVRKAGKLPRVAASRSYELEYGTATLELPADAVAAGGAGVRRGRRAGHRWDGRGGLRPGERRRCRGRRVRGDDRAGGPGRPGAARPDPGARAAGLLKRSLRR